MLTLKCIWLFAVLFVAAAFLTACGGNDDAAEPTGEIKGTITYTGAGTVSATNNMLVAVWPKDNVNMQGPTTEFNLMTSTPANYSFTVETGTYHAAALFDSNGDGVWDGDNTTSYEIYDDIGTFDGSSLTIIVLEGQTLTVNITFDDTFTK